MIEWEKFSENEYVSRDDKLFKIVRNGNEITLWTVDSSFVPMGHGKTDKEALKDFHLQICDQIEALKVMEEEIREVYNRMDGEE